MSFEVFSRLGEWFVSDGAVLLGPYTSPLVAQASANRQNELRTTEAMDVVELLDRTWRTPPPGSEASERFSR